MEEGRRDTDAYFEERLAGGRHREGTKTQKSAICHRGESGVIYSIMADFNTNRKGASPDKLPPQSLEAEMSLLGSLMLDKDAMIKVADFLEPRDFYKSSHGMIYEAMQELFEKGDPIDVLSAAGRLKEKNRLE